MNRIRLPNFHTARQDTADVKGAMSCYQRGPLLRILLLAGLLVLLGCGEKSSPSSAPKPPADRSQTYTGTIVAMGDSLTAGLRVAEEDAYPAQLARRLQAAGYTYRVVNAGVSGETSSGAWSRIEWVLQSLQPDIVILETGANDGLRGLDPDLIQSNLERLVGLMRERDIVVVLAGMRMLPNLGPAYTREFSQVYSRIAEKHDIILIPFFLEGVAGRDDLNQADKLHPTAEGYTRIVDTIYPYVIEAIQRHATAEK